MRTNRKLGKIEMHALAILLIVALSAIILILVLMRVKDIATNASEGNCAALARDMHFTTRTLGRDAVESDIKGCETEFITLERNDFSNDPAVATSQMQKELAEEMRQCWQDWGRGELDLFKDEGAYCHVCSRIHFENPNDEEPIRLTDFPSFLEITNSSEGKTYAESLRGSVSKNAAVDIENFGAQNYAIDTTKDQLILFVYMKYDDEKNIYEALYGSSRATPLVSAGTAAVIGAALVPSVPAAIVVAAGGGFVTYVIHRFNSEGFYTLSAIYITPEGPDSYNAEDCERLAAVTQSP